MFRQKFIYNTVRRLVQTEKHRIITACTIGTLCVSKASCEYASSPAQLAPPSASPAHIVLPDVKPTPINALPIVNTPKSLYQTLVERVQEVKKNVQTSMRYASRLMTYLLYASPLMGLVPINYFLGESIPAIENATWTYLVWAVQHLGPTFIKLAQWASSRPDLFPPKLVEKIVVLQDDVKVSYGKEVVEETLDKAFGLDWRSRLTLDEVPLGTGSVAQVFRGMLKQSKEELQVAIKMIHPHVENLIRTDMELLSIFAEYLDAMPQFEMLSLGDTCRDFAASMNLQLDLRLEAKHLAIFNKKFSKENWVLFPKPIDGFITKNVLVETLMEGVPINAFMALHDDLSSYAHKLKMKLSDLGCRLVLKMVFFDNYIHGDLHPGNIMVQISPNGEPRLIVLDCGIVYSSPSEQEHKELADICLAFMQHDGYRAGKLMLDKAHRKSLDIQDQNLLKQAGVKDKELVKDATPNLDVDAAHLKHDEEFCVAIQQLVIDAESESYFEHMGDYLARICELARKHTVRLDSGYFKIAMALKVAEGISLALDRNLDLITKCIPIVLKAQAMRKLGLDKFPEPENDVIESPILPPKK